MAQAQEFDLEQFLPYRIVQTGEAVSRDFYAYYRREYALTRPEWRVMAHLGQYGALTARDICGRAAMHKTKVSRAVAALERRKWLKRRPDDADNRVEWLSLTPAGEKAHRRICGEAARFNEALLRRLGAKEARTFIDLLDKLAAR
ncbi:MAG: MarR family winged helix-turn-helix transcriptional regulator [Pseudomonadota bacterium]